MPEPTDKPIPIRFEAECPEDYIGPTAPPGEWEKRCKRTQAILAALRGDLSGPRGADAFRQRFDLSKNPDRQCCLKNHFTGCAREYIGWLENMLESNPNAERFIFAR